MKSTKMSTRVQYMDPDWLLTHTQDETEQTVQFWTLDLGYIRNGGVPSP